MIWGPIGADWGPINDQVNAQYLETASRIRVQRFASSDGADERPARLAVVSFTAPEKQRQNSLMFVFGQ